MSNWRWAFSQGESTTAGAATVLTLRSLAGSRALGRSEAHAAGTSILPRMSETESAEVTPAAASEAIADGAVLIDVREKSEYDEAHIPGSVLIPLGQLGTRLDEVPTDRDVYVHCRMGGRSARAVDYLRAVGRANSYNVSGGIEAWEEAGLPVAR